MKRLVKYQPFLGVIGKILTFVPSSRTLKWVPTERVELRGGKIDEDNYSQTKT
jgi:hypothetical protein